MLFDTCPLNYVNGQLFMMFHIFHIHISVIGSKNNTHTEITGQPNEYRMAFHVTPDILTPDVPVKVNIEITTSTY